MNLNTVDDLQAETVIDAAGCIVLPGLIDFHGHVFHGGTAISVNPDIVCLPNGVTSMVDAGSSGWVNYQLFRNSVIHPAMVKIKSYLNVVNVRAFHPRGRADRVSGKYQSGELQRGENRPNAE